MRLHHAAGALAFLWPAATFAHGGHEAGGSGLLLGLAHPLSGMDHLLAAVAVGMWAAVLGGRAIWAVPAAFIGAAALGGFAGGFGHGLPGAEPAIFASVILLGGALALALRPPLGGSLAAVTLFGLAHGTAHGMEGPVAGGLGYGAGLLCATAGLHLAGVLAARGLAGVGTGLVGAGTALAGIALAVAS